MVSSSYVIQSTSIHYLQIGYSNLTLGNHNYVPSCPILNWSYISLPHPTRPSYHIHLVPSYPNDMGHMHWCSQYCPCPMIFREKPWWCSMLHHFPNSFPSMFHHLFIMFHQCSITFPLILEAWTLSGDFPGLRLDRQDRLSRRCGLSLLAGLAPVSAPAQVRTRFPEAARRGWWIMGF